MGDAGEGLVDADARIQERMDQLAAEKRDRANFVEVDPVKAQQEQSRKLARASLVQQLEATTHPVRRAQLEAALKDFDK